jgi:hypothetical protein
VHSVQNSKSALYFNRGVKHCASIREEHIMIGKKSLSALVIVGVLAASASSTAFAGGRYHGGGGGGNGLAIAAGILGAVAVGTIIANSASQPVYEAPQPAYYGPPPQQVYYQAPPQYYQAPPQPVYVREYREYPRDPYYYRGGYYHR